MFICAFHSFSLLFILMEINHIPRGPYKRILISSTIQAKLIVDVIQLAFIYCFDLANEGHFNPLSFNKLYLLLTLIRVRLRFSRDILIKCNKLDR